MYKLKVKTKNGEIYFSNLIFNDNEELEFTSISIDSDLLDRYSCVFNEEREKLELRCKKGKDLLIKLSNEQVNELKEIKNKIHSKIIHLYTNILNGKEELFFLETGLKDFPYVITSPTILDSKISSPKYNNALLYVFSEDVLDSRKRQVDFSFNNYESFQQNLGRLVKKRNFKPNKKVEGQNILVLKWHDLVI